MSAFSDHLEESFLNASLRGVNFTAPTATYMSLHTAAGASETAAAWAATELTGAALGYERLTVATSVWTDPAGTGSTSTNANLVFPTATSVWGDISHFALWDQQNSGATPVLGNLLYVFALPAPRTVANGDVFRLTAGNVTVILQ